MRSFSLSLLLFAFACNPADKPVDKTKVSDKKTPIVDELGAAANGAAAVPSPSQPPVAASAPAAPAPPKANVTSPGQNAKERRYAMTVGATETRDMTIQMTEESPEAPGQPQSQGFTLKVEFKVKSATPTANTLGATVKKVTALGKGPEVAAANKQLAVAAGLGFEFDVSPTGGVDNLKPVLNGDSANPQAAQIAMMVMQVGSEAFEALFPPLPAAAVGDGGSWEVTSQQESGATSKAVYTAQSWDKGALSVAVDMTQPKARAQIQGAGQAMVEGKAKGSYKYAMKLTGLPTSVQGERKDEQLLTFGPGKTMQVKRTSKVDIVVAK